MKDIRFDFPAIPESVNKLYFSRGGRRVLSGPGRKFKNSFVATGGGVSRSRLMSFQTDNDMAYELHLWFFLPEDELFHKTYGISKTVKSPFKDIDTSNLIKLAEDSISKLLGLRDRNNWTVCAHKRIAPAERKMVACLKPLNIQEDPYPCPEH